MSTVYLTDEIIDRLHNIYNHIHEHDNDELWVPSEIEVESEAELALDIAELLHYQEEHEDFYD